MTKKTAIVECLRCQNEFESWDKTKNRICPACKKKGIEYEECLMDDAYWDNLEDFSMNLDEDYWSYINDL